MENFNDFEPFARLTRLHDFIFIKTLGQKGDEIQLLGFLNAVLGRSGKDQLKTVEILGNRTFPRETSDGKSCVLDVLAVLEDGTNVNIEVQLSNQSNIDRRSLFYCSRVFMDKLKKGQDYIEMPNVIAINIVDFNFPIEGGIHTCFHLREDSDPAIKLTDALEIHFINMVKWRCLEGKDVKNDPLHRWFTWFDENSPPELIEEVANMDPAIRAVFDKYYEAVQDREAYREYLGEMMYEMDKRGQLKFAREEGLAEGMMQGREEIIRKMKSHGQSLTEIAEITGFSPEFIQNL